MHRRRPRPRGWAFATLRFGMRKLQETTFARHGGRWCVRVRRVELDDMSRFIGLQRALREPATGAEPAWWASDGHLRVGATGQGGVGRLRVAGRWGLLVAGGTVIILYDIESLSQYRRAAIIGTAATSCRTDAGGSGAAGWLEPLTNPSWRRGRRLYRSRGQLGRGGVVWRPGSIAACDAAPKRRALRPSRCGDHVRNAGLPRGWPGK